MMIPYDKGTIFFLTWLGVKLATAAERGADVELFNTAIRKLSERRSNTTITSIPVKHIGMDVHGLPVHMPLVGAGTWQYNDTIAYQSLCKAFTAGITFVDTALGYKNQKGVGKAIRDCWQGKRQDLFVMQGSIYIFLKCFVLCVFVFISYDNANNLVFDLDWTTLYIV
jgi:Aldo/keto reductase family